MSTQPDERQLVTYKLQASEMLDEKLKLHESWDEHLGWLFWMRDMSRSESVADGFTRWVACVRADLAAKRFTMKPNRLMENGFTHHAANLFNLEREMKKAAADDGEWSAEMQRVLGLIEQAWTPRAGWTRIGR